MFRLTSPLKKKMKSNSALLLAFVFSATLVQAGDWPHWRGAKFDGISEERIQPSASPKILWKAAAGIGFSSFSVAGSRVFTMGHEDGKDTIWCFDAASGKTVWSHSYDSDLGDKYFEGGTTGTPTVDGGRVFVLSRWGDVFCLDAASGKVVWNRNVRQDGDLRIPDWGYSGSPLVSGGTLLLNMGESGVALDKATGKTIWQSKNKDAGYSTPYPYSADGKPAAIIGSGRSYIAVEIATGNPLWSLDWRTSYGVNAADPIVHDGQVFISSGYEKGCALVKLGSNPPPVVWTSKAMRNQMSPSILIGGHLYGIDGNESKNAVLKCIDWATGAEKWTYPPSGCGTVAAAGGQLIVLSDKGELSIGKATPEGFTPVSRSQILSGRCWTVPVVAHGRLYARNAAGDVVCVDVGGRQ